LSDEVFGTSGDAFNLKKGYAQSSHNQLTINPGGSSYGIVDGVTTITVATNATQGANVEMTNAVTEAIKAKFGVSHPTDIANQ
jgi:proline racemase